MLARHVILVILLCAATGCYWQGPKRRRLAHEHRTVPLEWSKAVEPHGQERATYRVRFDVLYVARPETLPESRSGQWFRFWPDGRALEKMLWRGQPTAANADDFAHSTGCFYSIVGDRITIEWIGPGPEAPFGPSSSFVRDVGQVHADGTFTIKYQPRGLFSESEIIFAPVSVGEMTRQPDW